MTLAFRPCPFHEEPAATLLDAMRAEMAEMYDGLNIEGSSMPKAGPGELGPPEIHNFNDNPVASFFGEKPLAGPSARA